ncbi:hypothetical protein FLL96_11270 [Vibrio cholerae]|uniref:Fimbrial protein n=1 Tax=Vibrio cholerae TaxID=666 RepID=A0A544DJD3_VIBCL|nr:hypothetical protein [Vibrio cholerae]EJL6357671.1 hypothetical protein [Vibrio cholerae]KAA1228028.1 hypothetical protein F0Q18_00450 [Vibrio cholerae]MCD6670557.1 hypothetical protein [Vibrio cholerae]TQO66717.1 hypothetical protein FLM08_05625 [Vibrio cholerae]TQP08984.1 hypothetical protein FLM02_18040 [Vibrio cholerae]
MISKIQFIACSTLATSVIFTSGISQAAVNGSLELNFQSSITSGSCEIGVIDESGNSNLSNTVILPSLTPSEVNIIAGVVGTSVSFSVGALDPEACFNGGAVTTFDMIASGDQVHTDVLRNSFSTGPTNMGVQMLLDSGDSILNAPFLGKPISSAEDTVVNLKAQLFHLDTMVPNQGLIGSTAVFTTAYY